MFEFAYHIPSDYRQATVVISGLASSRFNGWGYLIHKEQEEIITIYEMRFEYRCGPFKQVDIFDDILAVGCEEYFYVYDLKQRINLLSLKMEGYYGSTYIDEGLLYVADAYGLFCLNIKGNMMWENKTLGIDGVIIHTFDGDKIYGSGEWDPPGAWITFVLNKKTGNSI